jgi:Mcm10 replication factor
VAEAELAAADTYFDKMEKRDEMESKMLSTFEMKTKAVTCHVCNYTSFKVPDSSIIPFCICTVCTYFSTVLLPCALSEVKL